MKTTNRATVVAVFLLLLAPFFAVAEDKLVKIDTRPGVSVSYYYMPRPGATATVVLLTGGAGGIGMKNGVPISKNFLVRNRDLFAAQGFNVAVVGKPTDREDLDFGFRVSAKHMEDLQKVAAHLKRETGLPVWFVGTSMGTISATASAIAFGDSDLAGIVLTSSITRFDKLGAVPTQKLDQIHIPVLVMHHAKDQCFICQPHEVSYITKGLKNARVKKELIVNGGSDPRGDPCEPMHWHGYIGMDKEAVDLISGWIKNPQP